MRRKLLGLILLAVVLVAGFWGVAGAQQNFRAGNTTLVRANETIDSALWAAGRTIDIAGTVDGDVYCAGQHVTVSGTVNGDLLCAAQTIVVSGEIQGDVRIAAQTVTLSGSVADSVTVAAQSFSQGGDSTIGRDTSIAATDITLSGTTGRDLAFTAQNATINGQVDRDVSATVNRLQIGPDAQITGDLAYTSANNAQIASGAVVEGEVTKSAPKKGDGKQDRTAGEAILAWLGSYLYFLAAALLVALALALLFPQAIHAIAGVGLASPWESLLTGIVAALVVPAISIILMLTVIGIPLALVLLLAWLLLQVFAGVVSAYYLGRIVWRAQRNVILTMLIGVALLTLLYFVPVVGFIAFILAMLLGTGMILLALGRRRPKPAYAVDSRKT